MMCLGLLRHSVVTHFVPTGSKRRVGRFSSYKLAADRWQLI